ncbi:hypothetical protein [uncultured Tateyamaria sp.]|uniref:hypothetical protein n=1 Tax=uncultured Tateyamaria sp. TaxID=455651 RepID=UPI002638ACD0|nr:hypothetical protein [uncultured Tateyamaria sp.]
MKLILHIGTPKTASTLIQNSLENNPEWLAEHGLAYGKVLSPDANHITLFFACANAVHDFARDYGLHSMEELAEFRQRVSDRIEWHKGQLDDNIDTMIMSSENLTGNMYHPEEIARLKHLLEQHFDDIKIVIYVRRQDDAILSMYGEYMRRGFSNDLFRDFVDVCMGPDSPTPYLYYRRELSKWVKVWGADNMIVRRFSSVDFINGDILADFLGIVLNTWDPNLDGFEPSRDDNRGLSAPMLELLRRLHPNIAFMKDGHPNPQRTLLTPYISQMPTHPRPVMAAGTARHIIRHFEPANSWLKQTFFPDLEGPFFPERPDHPTQGNLGRITEEEIVDLTSQLLSKIWIVNSNDL